MTMTLTDEITALRRLIAKLVEIGDDLNSAAGPPCRGQVRCISLPGAASLKAQEDKACSACLALLLITRAERVLRDDLRGAEAQDAEERRVTFSDPATGPIAVLDRARARPRSDDETTTAPHRPRALKRKP